MEKGPILKTRPRGSSGCVAGGRSGKTHVGFREGPAARRGNRRETAPRGKTAARTHQHPPVERFLIAPVLQDGEQPGVAEREGRGGGCQEQSGTLRVSGWDVPQSRFPRAQGLLRLFKHSRTSTRRPPWWPQGWARRLRLRSHPTP